ncbi:MerR family transcriptional regulator [Cohnella hongkongensis]|uniref:MerR family transcriptional regulator n=1 Tax=Cohnella hongkongensis TaxID=178337 RepID=A0ABV9FBU8_9BACL
MRNLKTREASERLGVSQTTVKRWASHYPSSFRKDPLGHYVFSQREFGLLQYIQSEIERGQTLEQISLPAAPAPVHHAAAAEAPRLAERTSSSLWPVPHAVAAEAPPSSSSGVTADDKKELLARMVEIERILDQKADEVVSAQVRQHRTELDELRRIVARLSAAVEALQSRAAAMVETARGEEMRLTAAHPALPSASQSAPKSAALPERKRKLFRTFF